MNKGLARIVGEVRAGTDTIAETSSRISAGNKDLSTRTEQQAGTLEETIGIEQIHQAISQMDQVIQRNAAMVGEAAGAADALQDAPALRAMPPRLAGRAAA